MDDSDSETAKDNYIEEIRRHDLLSPIMDNLINGAYFYFYQFYQDDG